MDKRTLPNEVLLGEVAAVLRDGREAVIIPSGNSMLPFIRGGVDRVAIRRQADVAVGDMVYLQDAYGRQFPVRVSAKDLTKITFDANHEMAGKELNFTIELVAVLD